MIQHGPFQFAIQTKLKAEYSSHVLFKAKVRQIRQGEPHLLDDYCDYLKQFCLHVPWSNYNILEIYVPFIHMVFFTVKDTFIHFIYIFLFEILSNRSIL